MLTYRLLASDEMTLIIREIMRNLGNEENEKAELTLVENGYELPTSGIYMGFAKENVADLIRLLYKFNESKQTPDFIIGRKHETFEPLQLDDILFFRSSGNTLFAHTEKQAYEMKHKLFEMEKLISCSNFIRVNKSNIVNILKIKEIIPWFGGRILLRFNDSEERIEVSRNYAKDFKQFLDM
ncbi:MAG TPA: LytTR family DNA-binding domain-containing protein [Treponemataceae bacterium]|nr:LytTR family DNA-binding domain-containing protein [Treponemataceae bacterium]